MLKKTIVVGGLLVACSSTTEGNGASSSGGGACADISGNYSVDVERVSGTCDPALDPKTSSMGVHEAGDGTWVVVLPGIEGGCPGKLDGCKFTSACELRDKTGAVIATATISYTFTSSGFTGSTVTGVRPPAVSTPCEVTYRETGTKL